MTICKIDKRGASLHSTRNYGASHVELVVKHLPANAGDIKRHEFGPWVGKIPLEKGMATHPCIFA